MVGHRAAALRCLASSPAAAEQTMLNRSVLTAAESTDDVDEFAEPRVLDTDLDDTLEGEDAALSADTTDPNENWRVGHPTDSLSVAAGG